MRLLRTVSSICLQNLRKWQTDFRVWTIAALLLIMVGIYADDMKRVADSIGTEMPIWIFPFLYSQFHTKLIFTFPLILLFCDAPFIDSNQTFVYTRVGRKKWLFGQILYIAAASGIYYLFLFAASIVVAVFYGGECWTDWGETLMTSSGIGTAAYGSPFIKIEGIILDYFMPIQAVWFTFLMSWLCGIFIGLTMFLCNYFSETRALGLSVSSFLLALSVPVKRQHVGSVIGYFSPLSWNTLDCIDVGGETSNPTFTYCLSAYLILISAITAAIIFLGGKKSIDVKEG